FFWKPSNSCRRSRSHRVPPRSAASLLEANILTLLHQGMPGEILIVAIGKIRPIMTAATLDARERRSRYQESKGVQIPRLIVASSRFLALRYIHSFEFLDRRGEILSVAQDADLLPHYVSDLIERRRTGRFGSGFRGTGAVPIARERSGASRQASRVAFRNRKILDHRLTAARAEHETLEQGIAGEPIGAVHSGVGGFSGRVQARKGGASREIGFYSAHHVMSRRGNRSHISGEIESIAQAGLVNPREALFEKFFF